MNNRKTPQADNSTKSSTLLRPSVMALKHTPKRDSLAHQDQPYHEFRKVQKLLNECFERSRIVRKSCKRDQPSEIRAIPCNDRALWPNVGWILISLNINITPSECQASCAVEAALHSELPSIVLDIADESLVWRGMCPVVCPTPRSILAGLWRMTGVLPWTTCSATAMVPSASIMTCPWCFCPAPRRWW